VVPEPQAAPPAVVHEVDAGTTEPAAVDGRRRWRRLVPILAAAVVLGPLGWLWQGSRLPASYSVMDMGRVDLGGPRAHAGHDHHAASGGTPVTALAVDPHRRADVSVTLAARAQRFTLASGRGVDGYTLNGTSPGPTIRARLGQLVEVRLVNESVPDGVTLHWHGVDVPNGADGVAGVTQDAVRVGQSYTYRFVVRQTGTFWYHSHQVSHEQVQGGLFGALVLLPEQDSPGADVLALSHLYGGVRTTNGLEGDVRTDVAPGGRARVRVVNTDNGPMSVWVAGAAFRVLAVDGTDLHGPTPARDVAVLVTAGARVDLEVVMPDDGRPVRVHLGGPSGVVLGTGTPVPVARPPSSLDLLTYGTPAPLGFDPGAADRRFEYSIGRQPGFVDGRPGFFWTVNGGLFPDVPMFVVAEHDIVTMRVENHSGDVHPMHLHGHHAVVLSRDGVPSTGSPWWFDSLNVENGESYEIAFVADNPGIWMDHCHNLPHAEEGLVAHLAYEGVTTPFVVRGPSGNAAE
jgi:FtsP/CotA-like multicopper oxidase with cupredoxin domain